MRNVRVIVLSVITVLLLLFCGLLANNTSTQQHASNNAPTTEYLGATTGYYIVGLGAQVIPVTVYSYKYGDTTYLTTTGSIIHKTGYEYTRNFLGQTFTIYGGSDWANNFPLAMYIGLLSPIVLWTITEALKKNWKNTLSGLSIIIVCWLIPIIIRFLVS